MGHLEGIPQPHTNHLLTVMILLPWGCFDLFPDSPFEWDDPNPMT